MLIKAHARKVSCRATFDRRSSEPERIFSCLPERIFSCLPERNFERLFQPPLKPPAQMLQPLHPVMRLPTSRQLMILIREPHKHSFLLQKLQRRKKLLRLLNRAPQILLTMNQHHRRLHILHILNPDRIKYPSAFNHGFPGNSNFPLL